MNKTSQVKLHENVEHQLNNQTEFDEKLSNDTYENDSVEPKVSGVLSLPMNFGIPGLKDSQTSKFKEDFLNHNKTLESVIENTKQKQLKQNEIAESSQTPINIYLSSGISFHGNDKYSISDMENEQKHNWQNIFPKDSRNMKEESLGQTAPISNSNHVRFNVGHLMHPFYYLSGFGHNHFNRAESRSFGPSYLWNGLFLPHTPHVYFIMQ